MGLNTTKVQAIGEAVVDALVNSTFGQKVNDAIKRLIDDSYNNLLDGALKMVVMNINVQVDGRIVQQHLDEIKAAMKAKLTDEMRDSFIGEFWHEVMKNRR